MGIEIKETETARNRAQMRFIQVEKSKQLTKHQKQQQLAPNEPILFFAPSPSSRRSQAEWRRQRHCWSQSQAQSGAQSQAQSEWEAKTPPVVHCALGQPVGRQLRHLRAGWAHAAHWRAHFNAHAANERTARQWQQKRTTIQAQRRLVQTEALFWD